MNPSKDFFPELKALQFPELKALRDKMNARSEPDLDMGMRLSEVPVTKDDFEIDDEIPIIQNRKVVLYITIVWTVSQFRISQGWTVSSR